ncbi:sensor histidine kinase [Hyphomicrobium sp.]|uniref:sensor histidine kinase n=1 Tax=Hyphomicrobium sp. TaxID=82 RepID=UPI002E31CE9F|nr:sensor histidine kinase [Hyphomicrobium sp.]HEX2842334.1 sensor histidine kinase [Hyphomicrobium sp.]
MTDPAASAAVLIVDAVVARHAVYRNLLEDIVSRVVTVTPGDEAARLAGDPGLLAIIINLEGIGADNESRSSELASLLGAAGRTPFVLIAHDVADALALEDHIRGSLDFLAWPIVPAFLRSKVGLLADLAYARHRLADAGAGSGALNHKIDELKRALGEERQTTELLRSLVGEQIHRSKNLLAIIQSVSMRTLGDGREMGDAREALAGRLRAMARAHEFLIAANGRGTEISDMVEAGLGAAAHRATASGPPARLSGSVVLTFVLAIHELASNATKYGAFSGPDGSVAVGWTFFETGPDRYLEVAWTERGGPPVHAPPRRGFGLALVSSLSRSGTFSFEPDGFACRMRLSQDMILAD